MQVSGTSSTALLMQQTMQTMQAQLGLIAKQAEIEREGINKLMQTALQPSSPPAGSGRLIDTYA